MLNHKFDDSTEISNALDHAALQANKLTTALRERGVEAYEFHDRYGSFVTIGSFEQLGSEIGGGQFQYSPQIKQVINDYCGYRQIQGSDPRTGARITKSSINSLKNIPFDVEGKPMAVPKRDTSKLYSGSLMGR